MSDGVPAIGVIVIGRNEGERLRRSLAAVMSEGAPVLYVDSASTDGSVELARSLGADVYRLDSSEPLSAARARVEGVGELLRQSNAVRYLQFVDGDCELASGWLSKAAEYLEEHPAAAVVCGHLSERVGVVPLYSRLSPQTWKQPIGEIDACGGVFMIRRTVYEAVGGFNPALLTREERDLCVRVRASNGRIIRLDCPMAQHDSGITCFGQWWARAVWGGYGDALSMRCSPANRWRLLRVWVNAIGPPLLIIGGAAGLICSRWPAIAILVGIGAMLLQLARIALARCRQGDSIADALEFAGFAVLRSLAGSLGFLRCFVQRDRATSRPDPRLAGARPVTDSPME